MTLHPLTSKEGAFVLKLGLVFKNIRVPMVHGYFYFGRDSKRTVLLKYQILLPQPEQNLAEPSTSFPQFGQCLFCSTLVPQTEQNRSLSDNSAPQLVQIFAVDG